MINEQILTFDTVSFQLGGGSTGGDMLGGLGDIFWNACQSILYYYIISALWWVHRRRYVGRSW